MAFGGQNTGTHLYFGECGIETHFFPQKSPPAEAVEAKVNRRRTAKRITGFIVVEFE